MTFKQLVATLAIYDFDELAFRRQPSATQIYMKKGEQELTRTVPDNVVYTLNMDVVDWFITDMVKEVANELHK